MAKQSKALKNLLELVAEIEDENLIMALGVVVQKAISGGESDEEEEEEFEEGQALNGISLEILKLKRRVDEYRLLEYEAEQIGQEHPFVTAQQPRMIQCRKMILLDLSNSLRQTGDDITGRLKIMSLFRDMDASREAISALKSR